MLLLINGVCSQWKFHKVALEMLLLLVRCDARLPTSAVQLFVNNIINNTINVRKVTTHKCTHTRFSFCRTFLKLPRTSCIRYQLSAAGLFQLSVLRSGMICRRMSSAESLSTFHWHLKMHLSIKSFPVCWPLTLTGHGFESHCGPFACNLEQVTNLRCAQVNSASYSSQDGKRVPIVTYGLRDEDLV